MDKVSILLVDDVEANLQLLDAYLDTPERTIVGVKSGHEAIALLQKQEFAIVLLDVQMPEMDGFEVARRIRTTFYGEHVPIIFITALHNEEQYVFQGYESGAVDFLFKPVVPAIIKSKVNIFEQIFRQHKKIGALNNELQAFASIVQHQNEELDQINEMVSETARELLKRNNDLQSSIRYAARIQRNIIVGEHAVQKYFPQSFVSFLPKEELSGDFYWINRLVSPHEQAQSNPYTYVAVADCTGHGIPGAMMSVMCHNFLNNALYSKHIQMPSRLLESVNMQLFETLNATESTEAVRDGMEIIIIRYDETNKKLMYAGAGLSLYLLRNNELITYETDKIALGINDSLAMQAERGQSIDMQSYFESLKYNNHEITVQTDDIIYLFSDGVVDQFGGTRERKLLFQNLKKWLLEIALHPIEQQKQLFEQKLHEWRNPESGLFCEQTDDITLIGIKF